MFNITSSFDHTKPNFAQYVDYSNPPHRSDNSYFVGDISHTVTYYLGMNGLVEFYHYFPLHEIIEVLLSNTINHLTEPGHWEHVMSCTYDRIGSKIESIDFDFLEIFYENLLLSIDDELENGMPGYKQCGDYVFYRWFDPVSVCMKHEPYKRPRRPAYKRERTIWMP